MATVDELIKKAEELIEKKKYQGVIKLLPDSVLEEHKSDELYAAKAMAYDNLKEYNLCLEAAGKALSINPNNARAHNSIGNVYYDKGQYEKAIEEYKKGIACNPTLSYPYYNLGLAYYRLKQYEKAIEAYKEAIEIDPKDSDPYNGLGNAYQDLQQYENAIEAYNKALQIDSKFLSPYNGLGSAYMGLNQYENAIEAYNKAIQIDPTNDTPYYNRALLNFKHKRYKESLVDYENYIALTKDNPDYFTSLAKEKITEIGKLVNDQDYRDIDALVNKIKELLLYNDECVTHYTSMTVAKTLILDKDSKFRLSEGAYLNDTSEGRELFKYLHLSATPVDGHDTVAEPFAKKPFIGSFVAEGKHDDLTLWRMYGKEAKEEARGWAITLQRDELLKKLQEHFAGNKKEEDLNEHDEFNFYRVAYCKREANNPFTIPSGKKADERKLNVYMKDLAVKVEAYSKNRLGNVADKKKLLELLNEIAYLFKSYEYQYEHEIRLVLKGTGIKIFIDMGVTPPKVFIKLINIRPVLKKITLGPKVEKSDEWASALFYALDKDGLTPEILISHLPFK